MRHELDFFNPWHELHRVRHALGQAAADRRSPLAIRISDNGAKISAALPGLAPDKLDISVLGKTVTLRGQRADAQTAEGITYLRRERDTGAFHRQVELPFRIDAAGVQAQYTDGILTVTLPRSAEDKPQRIAVQAA